MNKPPAKAGLNVLTRPHGSPHVLQGLSNWKVSVEIPEGQEKLRSLCDEMPEMLLGSENWWIGWKE